MPVARPRWRGNWSSGAGTPAPRAAVISDGTTERQQVLVSTLGQVAEDAAANGVRPPAGRGDRRGRQAAGGSRAVRSIRAGRIPGRTHPDGGARATDAGRGVSHPVLLAVAHGSRHPEAQQTVRSLAGRVAGLAPGTEVRTAFVQNAEPSLAEALAAADQRQVVIVPLLPGRLPPQPGHRRGRLRRPVCRWLPRSGPVPGWCRRWRTVSARLGRLRDRRCWRRPGPSPTPAPPRGPEPGRPARRPPAGAWRWPGVRVRRPARGGRGGRRPGRPHRARRGRGQLPAGPGRLPRPAPRERGRVGRRPHRRPPRRGLAGPGALPRRRLHSRIRR